MACLRSASTVADRLGSWGGRPGAGAASPAAGPAPADPSGAPHWEQNLDPEGLSAPQPGQATSNRSPHWEQNFAEGGLSNRQDGQVMTDPVREASARRVAPPAMSTSYAIHQTP